MADLLFRRQASGLLPDTDEAWKAFYALPAGSRALIPESVFNHDPRSIQQHRWFFGLIGLLFENTAHPYHNKDHFRKAIQFALGWTETIDIKGNPTTIPLSLSFKSMSQREFNQRVKQAEDWVKTDLWPHIGDDLKRMIEEYLEESA